MLRVRADTYLSAVVSRFCAQLFVWPPLDVSVIASASPLIYVAILFFRIRSPYVSSFTGPVLCGVSLFFLGWRLIHLVRGESAIDPFLLERLGTVHVYFGSVCRRDTSHGEAYRSFHLNSLTLLLPTLIFLPDCSFSSKIIQSAFETKQS